MDSDFVNMILMCLLLMRLRLLLLLMDAAGDATDAEAAVELLMLWLL